MPSADSDCADPDAQHNTGIDSSYSFEAVLLQSTRFCQVWIYDSTKGESAKNHIPRSLRHRAHFAKLALGAADRHGSSDDPKRWTLRSLMAENGASVVFVRLNLGWVVAGWRGRRREGLGALT